MQVSKNRYLFLSIAAAMSLYQCGPEKSSAQTDDIQSGNTPTKTVSCLIAQDRVCRFPVQELNTEYDAKGVSVMFSQLQNGPKFEQLKVKLSSAGGRIVLEESYKPDANWPDKTYTAELNNVQNMAVELTGIEPSLGGSGEYLEFKTTGALIALLEQTVSPVIKQPVQVPTPEVPPPQQPKDPVTELSDEKLFGAYNFSKTRFGNAEEALQSQLREMNTPKNTMDERLQTGSGAELNPLRRTELRNGTVVTRFEQSLYGIPIANHDLTLTQDGQNTRLSGRYLSEFQTDGGNPKNLRVELLSRLEERQNDFKQIAIQAYRNEYGDDASKYRIGKEKYSHYLRQVDDNLILTTSVSFVFRGENGLRNPIVIIDTATNDILKVEDGVRRLNHEAKGHGGNKNTGRYVHGELDFPALKVQKNGPRCSLENKTLLSSEGIITNDFWAVDDEHDPNPFEFDCSVENRNDERSVPALEGGVDWDTVNVSAYSPLNDAHGFSSLIMEMFSEEYSYYYDALTVNADYPKLSILAHEAEDEGAEYADNTIYLRDGIAGQNYPTAVPDIIAHEMGHWLTSLWHDQNQSPYPTSQEFLAIEESYGDMLGTVTEKYLFDTINYPVDSIEKIGEGVYPFNADYVRDICNPNAVSHLSHISSGNSEHANAGLFNKAFCELAAKNGWNYQKAFEVFTHANIFHWNKGIGFEQAALDVRLSAMTLGYDALSVGEAFQSVGICLPGFTECDDAAAPPNGDIQTYILTERLMITENSGHYCPLNDESCYQQRCSIVFGGEFTSAGCFSEGDSFLCAIECKSEVRL